MDGNTLFFLIYQARERAVRPRQESVFVDHRIDEHFRRPSAPPLVFVPDPHQPDFYGRVRSVLLEKSRKKGVLAAKIGGIWRRFRIEDGGSRFMTLHPQPEWPGSLIPVAEVVATDRMVYLPWHC